MEQRDDDKDILVRIQKGDHSAMAELISRYKSNLYSYLYRTVGQDCDDLFQETWIKVWENTPRFDIKRAFRPWLFTIASNLCKDYWRKKQTIYKYEKQKEESPGSTMKADPMDIKKALAELSAEQRNTLMLRYYEGFTETEIAGIMRCPQGTVKTRVFQAIRKLREVFKDNG
ncbi:MAG: hypothetical protein A2161_19640 [Candidatus Schekmanbacteria bacterium RBG_13_48_7]|uniref:RNA polymerase subunit sigma n=1 Tax=Candidatus Schekmanbacteria bacterium RBG_13_48_7 TaxID=1817878 RepID=A0A1F7RKX7_9BACT|nr:MAG: hypothetical protein A2161_19640 [Candidatus Schekmanbacteria bacterium RBG_13_48_7]